MNEHRIELLGAALRYASRGWHVFPCRVDGKAPVTTNGLNDATVEEKWIRRWWHGKNYNVAIRCGAISGLWVLDVDNGEGKDGLQSFMRLCAQHEPVGCSIKIKTPHGWHMYFAEDARIRNSQSRLGPGIDTRAEGGYVLAPPSIVGGVSYSFLEGGP